MIKIIVTKALTFECTFLFQIKLKIPSVAFMLGCCSEKLPADLSFRHHRVGNLSACGNL